ncbi:hypothetical protein DFH94DRAFT_298751 [Russula ochroleuca]|jgi:hypothetical protein|uniref:Uncharacterized protein n=1 Tax=Russula ochroleuca TaxID=152965 RepID=A0A9P5MP03_9AGAM|nr:hypothetical protein DFH94DRAFT_298751 [Russula ochroleuca]
MRWRGHTLEFGPSTRQRVNVQTHQSGDLSLSIPAAALPLHRHCLRRVALPSLPLPRPRSHLCRRPHPHSLASTPSYSSSQSSLSPLPSPSSSCHRVPTPLSSSLPSPSPSPSSLSASSLPRHYHRRPWYSPRSHHYSHRRRWPLSVSARLTMALAARVWMALAPDLMQVLIDRFSRLPRYR